MAPSLQSSNWLIYKENKLVFDVNNEKIIYRNILVEDVPKTRERRVPAGSNAQRSALGRCPRLRHPGRGAERRASPWKRRRRGPSAGLRGGACSCPCRACRLRLRAPRPAARGAAGGRGDAPLPWQQVPDALEAGAGVSLASCWGLERGGEESARRLCDLSRCISHRQEGLRRGRAGWCGPVYGGAREKGNPRGQAGRKVSGRQEARAFLLAPRPSESRGHGAGSAWRGSVCLSLLSQPLARPRPPPSARKLLLRR